MPYPPPIEFPDGDILMPEAALRRLRAVLDGSDAVFAVLKIVDYSFRLRGGRNCWSDASYSAVLG